MRIAYVIPAWPPLPSQPFVVNEMLEVQAAGHELVVCALYRGAADGVRHGTYRGLAPTAVLPPELLSPRILWDTLCTVARHPWRTLTTLLSLHAAAGAHPWAQLRVVVVTPKALAAARRLAALRVDRIHAHFASNTAECAAIAGCVSGIPYSFTAHAYDIYLRTPRVRNDTLAWKLRHAAQAIAISDFGARLLRARLDPAAAGKVHTVHVGIPTRLFQPEPPAPRGTVLRLLSVARFFRKKGLDTLVDACALLRDRGVGFRLRIFGDGPEREALETQVARLGLGEHVVVGTPIPQEEVAREMRACHAFVLPCREEPSGDMDGIPTVFMEALATGRPVVSCAVSGIPELVRDGETGLLVPSNDPTALANALERLGADDALRLRLGAAGRPVVEAQHDQARNAQRLLAVLARG